VVLSDPDTKHTIYRGEMVRRRRGQPTIATTTVNGTSVVRMSSDGGHVYVTGIEYHEDPMLDPPQSYIDRVAIEGGEKERIYESDNDGTSERLLAILDDDATQLLVNLESPTDVPDSYVRDTRGGTDRQLTQNIDYTPDITGAERRRYEVTRVDGFKFAVDVTLPQNWNGEPLPGMMWFYPREYTDQEGYDETRGTYNKNAFPNLGSRSMDILVRAGYAVIEPDAPIIGEEGRMNDNYEHDLRNNLAAVIDFLDKEGIIDRERLGIGGHSYGAFGTVNAMVHTPFFKAGIAGDGNYNRTLTPFAFQSERRSVWEAPNVYLSMSPLFHANNLTGALLMYHGEHDQNVGTFPINSWRLFEALESLGKTASLYVYPLEDHGPATRETLLDLWARWTAWLDKYVKNAKEGEKIAADD
jgi:dipeptidyl aminopeptidase/acylaminoacyl peptidase